MNLKKLGACTANLYSQFLYRIILIKNKYNLTNINIGLYSPTLYLTGNSWQNFRNIFLTDFNYSNGCLFQASHFADATNNWGISFSIWKTGETENKSSFSHNLINNLEGEIKKIVEKNVYNLDNIISSSVWVREEVKKLKTFDVPNLSSGVGIKTDNKSRKGMLVQNSLGYFFNAGNNVEKNASNASIFCSAYSNGIGLSIIPENFTKCTTLFSARKLISCDWVNSKDEYLVPNMEHSNYKEFENDSVIYSLFNTSSNQSSLRQIDYKDKKWDIKNEFFWVNKDEVLNLANLYENHHCFDDAYTDSQIYVYKLLQTIKLSKEAQQVLNKSNELLGMSFKYRELFNEEHPEYQVNNWDCGWYQIKAICKEYLSNELKKFNELYNKLGDKMRPQVYELGFLLK